MDLYEPRIKTSFIFQKDNKKNKNKSCGCSQQDFHYFQKFFSLGCLDPLKY